MSASSTQWERLLQNQGTWVGSFTQLSAAAEVLQEVPSEVALIPLNGGHTLRQTIRKRPPDQPPSETVLEYSSLGRGVLFCHTGAFSQGSIQHSPVSEFGAELGLIHSTERLRIAQIFPRQPTLGSLTLIREYLAGTAPTPRPELTPEQLLGTWVGEAETVYPDLQPPQRVPTRLEIQPVGDDLSQSLFLDGSALPPSRGRRQGRAIAFDQGQVPMTVLLLPDGASATFPSNLQPGQPFFLEVGWLITPTLRQRLIRSYSAQGTWLSLTLVIETRQ